MCFHANKYCSMTYNEHSCIKIEVRGARGGNTIPIFTMARLSMASSVEASVRPSDSSCVFQCVFGVGRAPEGGVPTVTVHRDFFGRPGARGGQAAWPKAPAPGMVISSRCT